MASKSEIRTYLRQKFPDDTWTDAQLSTQIDLMTKALFPDAAAITSENYDQLKTALDSGDERIAFALVSFQPKEKKLTEDEGFFFTETGESDAFLEWIGIQVSRGVLNLDEELDASLSAQIRDAFQFFESNYQNAFNEALQKNLPIPTRNDYALQQEYEVTLPDAKRTAEIVNELMNKGDFTAVERQKLFASLMGGEGGIASTGAKTEADIRAIVSARVDEAIQLSVSVVEKGDYERQVQDAIRASGLPVESQNAILDNAIRLYYNAELRGKRPDPSTWTDLITGAIKGEQFKVDGAAVMDGVTPEAPGLFGVGEGPGTPGGAGKGPPSIPDADGIPTPATGVIVPQGSQSEAFLQGLTRGQLAQQRLTESGRVAPGSYDAIIAGTEEADRDGFTRFLSGQQGDLQKQYQDEQAANKVAAAERRTRLKGVAERAGITVTKGNPYADETTVPVSFADYLKKQAPGLQQSFATEKVRKGEDRAAVDKAGTTVRVR